MNNRFMGIQTWQSPNDVWVTLEILWEVKPDFVVETGTHHGGSALLWATFLEQINPNARVVTIDIENKSQAARRSRHSRATSNGIRRAAAQDVEAEARQLGI